MVKDLRLALRLLWKDRAFSLTALLTLTVCIGANAAMFSIVRSVVLKPLPVPNAGRIVVFRNEYPKAGVTRGATSVPDYFDRVAEIDALETQGLYRRGGATLGGRDGARRLTTLRATPSFFRLVSASPIVGRVFGDEEGQEGRDNAALLSHALWQREFGGAPDVVGQDVRLDGTPYRIVGVLPADFRFLWDDVDVYLRASFTADDRADSSRHSNNWEMVATLAPGATLARAREEIDALNRRNDARFPQFSQILQDAGFHTSVALLQEEVTREVRPILLLLWGGVLFVLFIGGLNTANLVLLRANGRAREMATRHAVGASLWVLARQLFVETTLLAAIGGGAGLLLGWWLLALVPVLNLDGLPRGHEIALDPAGAALILCASLVVGLAVGLAPVARLWRINVNATLREEGRSGTASHRTNVVELSRTIEETSKKILVKAQKKSAR
jgi:predicted permease